ncbi:MAG: alpha/beta-type small acid-soluble spore protein [Defluviitaleaceae bacterium]|nr:alpha/beta-type small acid-soluble spore protein [Defluviitaleaceae bacterium]
MNNMKNKKEPTENDILKYEIAEELGLMDKVNSLGWKSLTARESGKIGGIMTKRKKQANSEQ